METVFALDTSYSRCRRLDSGGAAAAAPTSPSNVLAAPAFVHLKEKSVIGEKDCT
jgi:hypothetical protein